MIPGDSKPLTNLLASFVSETPPTNVPAAAVEAAKDLILDTLGVALAAVPRPIGQAIIGHVTAQGAASSGAAVLAARIRTSPALAALANGTLANALDFDEGSHLPTHILPSALAIAETHGLSGQALLDAFIIAYEAAARLTQTIDAGRRRKRGPTHRGWWHVGLVGPIAAALAVCRLLKLDRHLTATAIGIASCGSGGFRRNMGTMAKALHSGNAARLGIEAATLAQRGFTADGTIIEAPLGFLQAVCPPEDRDEAAITERLGRPFVLEGPLRMKRFPACNPGHPLIDAALRLRAEHHFALDDVDWIEADLHEFSLLRPRPDDAEAAGFSGAYLIAATLLHGEFGLDQLTDEAVKDIRIHNLMDRIRPVPAGTPEMLTVSLRGGGLARVEVLPVRRLTGRDAVLAKFYRCAEPALSRPAAERVAELVLSLERQSEVASLMAAAGGFVL